MSELAELDLSTSVGTWVAQHPNTSRVFESLSIDDCCGGGKPLAEVCQQRQLDPQQVVEQLEQAIERKGRGIQSPDFGASSSMRWTVYGENQGSRWRYIRHLQFRVCRIEPALRRA